MQGEVMTIVSPLGLRALLLAALGLVLAACAETPDGPVTGSSTAQDGALAGMARLRSGDAAGASAEFGRAVASRPADAGAMGGLAVARDLLGDRAGALAAHRQAQALAPEDAELLGNHALSLLIDQRAADAVRLLERFEQNPRAPRAARHNLALAAAAAGQEDRAVRLLRQEMSPAEALRLTREFAAFATALRALPPAEAAAALLGLGPVAGAR
ncbi:MAG: hypothetical protein MUF65_13030 [Rubritepida sp.]|jgi:Flp pilus assembly protein TadD|nr:hypothetical protein [Rubritepida sp.]